MSKQSLSVGAAQVGEVYLDRLKTIEKDCRYIRRAGDLGLDLVVFPEFHVSAAPQWFEYDESYTFETYYQALFENAVTVPGDSVDALCEAAAEAGTAVVIGVNEKDPGTAGTMYNTQVFIDADGTLLGKRRKLVPTKHERLFHTGGSGAAVRVFESSVGTLGGLICGEHTNPLAVYAVLAEGEEIHAASWPAFPWLDRETRRRNVEIRTRYHAYVGKVPVISASGYVTEALAAEISRPDWAGTAGGSAIIAPDGSYLAGPDFDREGIVHAEIDLAERIRGKALSDVLGHYNRFDVFELSVDKRTRAPLVTETDDAGTVPSDRGTDQTPVVDNGS